MKSLIILLFSFTSALYASSQNFLTRKKESVKKQLTNFYVQEKLTPVFTETDSSLTVRVKDSSGNFMSGQFSYYFKKNGRCNKETGSGDCKKCFTDLLNGAKNQKRFEWKKINEHFYLSRPFWQVSIVTSKQGEPFTYSIIYRYLKRDEHERLYKTH